MCVSVPHIPTAETRSNTSRGDTRGAGTSRTSIRSTSTSTHAFIAPSSASSFHLRPHRTPLTLTLRAYSTTPLHAKYTQPAATLPPMHFLTWFDQFDQWTCATSLP